MRQAMVHKEELTVLSPALPAFPTAHDRFVRCCLTWRSGARDTEALPLLSVLSFLAALHLPALQNPPAAASNEPVVRELGREEILAAMTESQGFDPTATTNGARLQAEVLLRLAREAHARDAEGQQLFIGHDEWFSAYLARTGLAADQAPLFIRLGYEHGQDIRVQYGNDRVIRRVIEGPTPAFALSVSISWPQQRDGPKSYSYEDLLSSPKLKVTNKRLISYRLLDFGDVVVFDEIEGLYGRPTSGFLGVLFSLIGEGHVAQNRMAISRDGLQVSRARAEKAFLSVVTTVTVYPAGRTEKGLPTNRPDLETLETLLKRPLRVEYLPLEPTSER